MEDKIREAAMKMGKAEDMPVRMIDSCMAAWADLTKDKLKVAIDRVSGPGMDRAAAVTVAYMNDYWMAAMQGKELPKSRTDEFVKSLNSAMSGR